MEIGTGTSIQFDSGFFAEVLDITPPNPSREAVNSSHMLTADNHTFEPVDLVNWGELKVDLHFDPQEEPPIDQAAESIVITFPDSAGTTWTFQGFMTNYEPKVPLEDKMTASATIKVTGGVTIG